MYKKALHLILALTLTGTNISITNADAKSILPQAGIRLEVSPAFTSPIVRGMAINSQDPFAFEFLIDDGNAVVNPQEAKSEYTQLIKYFLTAMTIAEDKQWVNLSPYEKERIIDSEFGTTEMGRDLLSQDYILKQMMASLLYPEDKTGKEFWAKIYTKAAERFGTTQIPINTFNKVWILPDYASIYEKDNQVLIVDSKLKVMLEEDYIAMTANQGAVKSAQASSDETSDLTAQILKELVIPALTKEVNEGKNFANLRQIYHGMVLAAWYKQALKQSIFTQVYANKSKVAGINLVDAKEAQAAVYQQYIKAFRKGAYNLIREEPDPISGQMIPRKYFSGGFNPAMTVALKTITSPEEAAPQFKRSVKGSLKAVQFSLDPVEDWASISEKVKDKIGVMVTLALVAGAISGGLYAKKFYENVPTVPAFLSVTNSFREVAIPSNIIDPQTGEAIEEKVKYIKSPNAKTPLEVALENSTPGTVNVYMQQAIDFYKYYSRPKTITRASQDDLNLVSKYIYEIVKNPDIPLTTEIVDQLADPSVFYDVYSMADREEQNAIFFTAVGRKEISSQRLNQLILDPSTPVSALERISESHTNLSEEEKSILQKKNDSDLKTDPGVPKSREDKLNDASTSYSDFLSLLNEGQPVPDNFFSYVVPGVTDDPVKMHLAKRYQVRVDEITADHIAELAPYNQGLRQWVLTHPGERLKLPERSRMQETLKDLVKFAKGLPREMTSADTISTPVGGIDLDSANLNLRIKRDGNGVVLPLDQQDPAMINAPGFTPVILQIKTADWPLLSQML